MSMKFLIIGDLHGRKPKIHYKNFDAIIAPGDFCSDKGIKPLGKKWSAALKKKDVFKKGKKVEFEGFIVDLIGKREWKKLNKESLKKGREILEYLNGFNVPVFLVPGNWDQSYGGTRIKNMDKSNYHYRKGVYDEYLGKELNKFLKKGLKNIYDCQYKLFEFNEFNIIGYGLSSFPEDPGILRGSISKGNYKKLRESYNKIFKRLSDEYKKRDKKKPTIFLSHNVPYNTKLDLVLAKSSYAYKKHYGSTIARRFCEKFKPLVCIGGHMHEHFGKCKLGNTVVVNSGFGAKVNTFMEVKGNKIKNLKFYRG
jgi:Icc-related predicted phosphoesterase